MSLNLSGRPLDVLGTVSPAAGRSWRDYPEHSLPPILQGALRCFVENGYHGTSIRKVADRVGLSVPGLYYHHPSKQALLVAIASEAMEDLWIRSLAALEEAGSSRTSRLECLVECLVLFHAVRRDSAFIAFSEIRSLEQEARTAHVGARDRQQNLVYEVLGQGVEAGEFDLAEVRETGIAIVTMCTGVSQWFQIGGPLTAAELAEVYVRAVRRIVGVRVEPSS